MGGTNGVMVFHQTHVTLPFMGVTLPRGTIEKLTGQKLTWDDEPVKLN